MDQSLKILNKVPYLENWEVPCNENPEFQVFLRMASDERITDLYVDTESNGQSLKDGRGHSVGMSIDFSPDPSYAYSYYFPFRHKRFNLDHTYLGALGNLIERGGKRISFWNAKHDLLAMESFGIKTPFNFNDVMLKCHSVNENLLSYRLDYISKRHGLPGKARDKVFDKLIDLMGWDGIPPQSMAEYAATDASLLRPLDQHYEAAYIKEDESNGELWEVDRKFILLLNEMEKTGAKVDLKLAEIEAEKGHGRMDEIAKEIGLNPGSREQLEELLLKKLELPVAVNFAGEPMVSAKTGKPSFDKKAMEVYEEYLQELNSPVAQLVLEYRGYQKAVSSYWEAYLRHVSPDGRIRPNFNMHRTRTHRLSCDTPNLQQIPRVSEKPWHGNVKQGFVPADGFELWEADYAQLEFRLGACYGQEERLIEIFNDPNRDVFSEMSLDLNMPRHDTKTLHYSLQYGAGIRRIRYAFGIPEADAIFVRDSHFNTYPGLKAVSDLAGQRCKRNGYVKTWASRRRHFEDRHRQAHKAFNAVVQGGAFEIVKRQMIKLAAEIGLDNPECRMILQVHDSIVFEIIKGKADYYGRIITKILEDVTPDFGVHFRVDWHQWGH